MKKTAQQSGFFLVIEGTDGSGKGTQFNILAKRLQERGYDVASFDFPRYEEPSSYFVQQYLNGVYGSAEEVGPYAGSLFFSLDRYEAAPQIRRALNDGKVVLANRFTGSNMAHQGTKFKNVEERRGFFIWLERLEFEMLNIPRPDKSLVLRMPAEIAQKQVDKKARRRYTDKQRDLLEADLDHLRQSVEVYDDLCQLFPKDFVSIECVRGQQLLSVEAVSDRLWQTVEPWLPAKGGAQSVAQQRATPSAKTLQDDELVVKTDKGYVMTQAGKKFLESAVTNSDKAVYAFTAGLNPITIAAAMARLSRRGDDMRITILDEFAKTAQKDERLLQRVITAYGDDSVQQLVGQHLVVEGASNLLTKRLEWGRLAAYLEQSTRYIYYDQKDKQGNYKYYVPPYMDPKTKRFYKEVMDQIFDLYSSLVHALTAYIRKNDTTPEAERDIAWQGATRAQACDAIRPVLPVATKSTVGIFASGQALESLIMHLLSDDLPEARQAGQLILDESRKVIGTFLERADKPDRGGAMTAYQATTRQKMQIMAQDFVPSDYSADLAAVRLVDYWPKNELALLPDMLYEYTNLSLQEIDAKIDGLTYEQKARIFKAYMGERLNRRHKPGRAIEKAHYSWDLVCDYGIFRDLQRHRMVDDLQWQKLTPRFGFDTPSLVDEADLTDAFQTCFDLSLRLHSFLQEQGYELEAQYATLLGHKMRWKITYNAREAFHLHELRTSPQGHPGYRKLVQQMHEKLAEVHPLLADAMKFVNKGEDPELTRLAAEKYAQFKMNQLDK